MIRTVDAEITAIPLLQEFVGRNLVARLGPQHPLARVRYLRNPEEMRSVTDVAELYELEVAARAIVAYLIGHGPDDRLLHDLRSAKDCRALLFEAAVLSELIEPYVGNVEWRRYEEAGPDISAQHPRLQIECTRMERYSFEMMAKRAEAKLRQKRRGEGPYLIVVGTAEGSAFHIIGDVTSPLRRRMDRWMGSHREASAFHFVAPRKMTDDQRVHENEEGYSVQVSRFFGVTVRNRQAVDPLPPDFENNWAIAP